MKQSPPKPLSATERKLIDVLIREGREPERMARTLGRPEGELRKLIDDTLGWAWDGVWVQIRKAAVA